MIMVMMVIVVMMVVLISLPDGNSDCDNDDSGDNCGPAHLPNIIGDSGDDDGGGGNDYQNQTI